jgi:hypothetical protein
LARGLRKFVIRLGSARCASGERSAVIVVGHELPEERPHRRHGGVGLVAEVHAQVAHAARPAERVQRLLVDVELGQVGEQRAVAAADDRRIHALRS